MVVNNTELLKTKMTVRLLIIICKQNWGQGCSDVLLENFFRMQAVIYMTNATN